MTAADFSPHAIELAMGHAKRCRGETAAGLVAARAMMEACALYIAAAVGPIGAAEEFYRHADFFSCSPDTWGRS